MKASNGCDRQLVSPLQGCRAVLLGFPVSLAILSQLPAVPSPYIKMLFPSQLSVLLVFVSAVAANTGGAGFYTPGMGACGIQNSSNDMIAAVSVEFYNANSVCNKMLTAHYQGKPVTVMVTDKCGSCGMFDLDLSPAAFNQLGDPLVGRLSGVEWSLDGGGNGARSTPDQSYVEHRMVRRKRREIQS